MDILVHYSEIAIKGKNRPFFERKLIENIKRSLKCDSIKKYYGYILLKTKQNPEILKHLPGIASYSIIKTSKLNIEDMKKTLLKIAEKKTFKIQTKRPNKKFPLKSPEVNTKLGKFLESKGYHAEFKNPEIMYYIEITQQAVYIYKEKIKGPAGLPVGSSGKFISLLSGGIDSPVASYLMLKRGCTITFVHFYNSTINTKKSMQKVKDLVKILSRYQQSKLYLVPFNEIQRDIIKNIPSKQRMILYRRVMLHIASKISKKEKAKGFVTGDNLGQVASQTIENLNAIYNATNETILTPLISYNKDETVALARQIGTYETSIQPYEDCCSFFIAKHPEIKANLNKITQLETKLDKKLWNKSLCHAEIVKQNQ